MLEDKKNIYSKADMNSPVSNIKEVAKRKLTDYLKTVIERVYNKRECVVEKNYFHKLFGYPG